MGNPQQKDMEIEDLKLDTAFRYKDGFDKAIEQVHVLFPSFDLSEADAMKSVVDGKLVLSFFHLVPRLFDVVLLTF